ncbi:helix-turn-helix domain-containing protein [Paenibacillus agricola]|uniref:Helix-turn-helix transcriptional regulator n=1 Tax=Paenibacillus agricola TaxID=2716264 RepID=A0ABX0JAN3_9BACL|nr:helix-turn-helix domain-containing protein [Paenibacillus agricola]NHN32341.1 helix-turn-helix transcriptional regulator [Paenibacillus agricola]
MNKKRIPTLNPLFFRILLYFLSLLLPIIIIGAVFYINVSSRLQDEFTQKIQMNLQSSANTIEIYLRTVQETSLNFFYEKKPLLLPYDEYTLEERVRIPEIPDTLSRVANNLSALIDNLFLFADDQKVYTGQGLDDFDYYFEKGSFFQKYNKEYWKNKLNTEKSIEVLEASEVTLNNGVHKNIVPLVFMNTVNGHKAILVTTISVDMIKKTVLNHAVTESTSFLVTDTNNNLIQSSDRNLLDAQVIRQISEFFSSGKVQHGELRIGNIDCIVNYVKSESYGWNYYSITPVSDFKEQTNYFVMLIVIICLVLIVVGILFSFIFTFNLYNPIKRISDILLSKSELNEPSNGSGVANEFEFIGRGIHQLIEFNHKFKNELEVISTEYMDQALLNYIHGSVAVNERDLHKMLVDQLQFNNNAYVCCNIKFGLKPAFYSDIQDTDRLIILDKIKKIIWGLINPHVNAHILEEKENLYIAVVNVQEEDSLVQVKMGLELLLDTFRYDSQYCYIHIGIGNIYKEIRGIVKSYADAMHVVEAVDANKDFQMDEAQELPPVAMLYSYSFMDENMILNCLKAQKLEGLEHQIEGIISKNKLTGAHSIVSALLSEMYHTGCRFLAEKGLNPQNFAEELEHTALRKKSDPHLGIDDKKRLLLDFFQQIIQHSSAQDQGKSSSLTSTIIKYIEDNYHHDLYLEKISGEMGVSTKYISRMFFEKTNVHLSTYISHFRISKAKELLVETDLNISDISQKVGIYSRTTFIRLFKKYEGITPNHYRNMKK